MKLIIFGATGTVGRHVTRAAIEAGHEVTTFSRSGAQVSQAAKSLRGDVLNLGDVGYAMRDHDAVICVLGAGRKGGVRARGTANIIAAMQQSGVSRLICQSTLGAGDSRANLNFMWKYIMFGLLLRPAYADHQEQEACVRNSGLDWTIVRPGAFTDGPKTGDYRVGFPVTDRNLALKISREDIAHFMMSILSDRACFGKSPGLSY